MFHWNRHQPPEDGLPPQDVRLTELTAAPWPEDARRVRVSAALTPFVQPPNLAVSIRDSDGIEVASIYMVEVIDARLTFTMHLRDDGVRPPYAVQARVLYEEPGIVDEKEITLPSGPANKPEV